MSETDWMRTKQASSEETGTELTCSALLGLQWIKRSGIEGSKLRGINGWPPECTYLETEKWGFELLVPSRLAQKAENYGVLTKLVHLLVSHMRINMLLTSDFHFSPVYFMLFKYFYIPVHFQLGMPNRKSVFL